MSVLLRPQPNVLGYELVVIALYPTRLNSQLCSKRAELWCGSYLAKFVYVDNLTFHLMTHCKIKLILALCPVVSKVANGTVVLANNHFNKSLLYIYRRFTSSVCIIKLGVLRCISQ